MDCRSRENNDWGVTREGRKTGSKERGLGDGAYPKLSPARNAAAKRNFSLVPQICNLG